MLTAIYGHRFNYLSVIWCLTLCRFRACADAVVRAIDLFSLHHDVLETFVVSVETVLQQLTESHRAAEHKSEICGGEKKEILLKQRHICERDMSHFSSRRELNSVLELH